MSSSTIRDGLKDARPNAGYLLREGWKAMLRVFILGLVMDAIYQFIVLRWFYPGEALITAFILLSALKPEHKWLSFRCPDGQTVMAQFELPQDQFVNVRFAGRELRLPHVISGSGARYSDGKTTFWNKGRSVLIEIDDKVIVQDCMLEGEP
jgi:membrane-bound inhibitor of C-type lysozyme